MADDADPAGAGALADGDEAAAAHAALREDEHLGPHVAEHGLLELEPAEDPFARLVRSVLAQQVSTDAAAAIRERLFDAVAVTPEGVLAAEEAILRDAGVSAAKTRYLRAIAETWQAESWSRATFEPLENDAVRDRLTAVTGVGPWTANMFLIFALGRPDVYPVGDLGVRTATERVFGAECTRAELRERAERWAPYRSYASLHLWTLVD